MLQKVVLCGTGFIGSSIAQALLRSSAANYHVQISSRKPEAVYNNLVKHASNSNHHISSLPLDITDPASLKRAFENSTVVVSMVGIMHGTLSEFEKIQHISAGNIAEAAQDAGAKLIHISAIGADEHSHIPYFRTKGLGEKAIFKSAPSATIIRPSIVFGPGDDFFNRFANLARYLPFLPVFGGGTSEFQPVYVEDLANAIEIIIRREPEIGPLTDGQILEAGGPDIITYREIMQLVLRYSGRRRPIISLPFFVGTMQGFVLERLPLNLFTVTRSQVEQLKLDNICHQNVGCSFHHLIDKFSTTPLRSVYQVVPTYLK